MGTLYIDRKDIHIRLDGNAIAFYANGKREGTVPINPLKRVIIAGSQTIETPVLRRLAADNISVMFLSGKQLRFGGMLHGRLHNNGLLRVKQYEKSLSDFAAEFAKELVIRKIIAQSHVLEDAINKLFKKTRINHEIGEGNYQMLLKGFKPNNEEQWTIVSDIVANLFRGLIIEHLIRADLDPHMGVIHRRHNLGLALDICYIMGAEGDMQSIQFFRSVAKSPFFAKSHGRWEVTNDGMRNIIHRFENRKEALCIIIDNIMDELFSLMRELRT
jgi:hypothetical protein